MPKRGPPRSCNSVRKASQSFTVLVDADGVHYKLAKILFRQGRVVPTSRARTTPHHRAALMKAAVGYVNVMELIGPW